MEIIPDLSLCLSYSGSPERLHTFLTSLAETADPVAYEAIVVYRASTPPPTELMRAWPRVLFLEERDEATPAAALNQALRLAKGRYLSLWADSTVLQPRTLYRLLTLLDDRPELGMAAPRLTRGDGAILANAGPLPSLFRHQLAGQIPPGQETPVAAAWLSDRALALRREMIDDVGPLDNGFQSGYADADLCRRAAREGWRLALYPAAIAIDHAPDSHPTPKSADLIRFLLRQWLGTRTANW